MRNPGSDYRAVSYSNGVNHTWTTPVSDTELIDPVNAASLVTYDESTILFTNTADTSSRINMTIRMSFNDGDTWDVSKLIYSGVSGYSDVAVGPDKTIYVLYEKPQGHALTLAMFNREWVEGTGADSFNGKTFKLKVRHSGMYADVNANSISDGADVIQWNGTTGANQEWMVTSTSNGYYKITARHSGKALAVEGATTSNSAKIDQLTYTADSIYNDEWSIVDLNNGYYRIVNRLSGKAMDMPGSNTTAGTQFIQWTPGSQNNQQFEFIEVQ